MSPRSNIHTHSRFSDGEGTLEEMVQAAVGKGFVSLGFSEHAWAPYDSACCIRREEIPQYLAQTAQLKEKYADKIELYTGFEVDAYAPAPREGLDFTIGSVHYLRDASGRYHTLDYLPEHFETARDQTAGGDARELVRLYYELLLEFAESYRPDVIGHVDLVTKLNRGGRFFDEEGAWYRNLIAQTARRIAATGCIVEVNTGGMARGYRDLPYPSPAFLELLCELDVPVLLSSDAHSPDAIDYWFEQAQALLRQAGYRAVRQLRGGEFVETPL